jgi:hypothetical protein
VSLASVKVKVTARDSLPRGARINPTDPSMSAACTNRSPRESATNRFTHVEAPLTSRAVPERAVAGRQVSGGWNRIHLRVSDLESEVERLRGAGVPFRTNEIVTGPGGAQVIIDDPSGNPIELFQPRR